MCSTSFPFSTTFYSPRFYILHDFSVLHDFLFPTTFCSPRLSVLHDFHRLLCSALTTSSPTSSTSIPSFPSVDRPRANSSRAKNTYYSYIRRRLSRDPCLLYVCICLSPLPPHYSSLLLLKEATCLLITALDSPEHRGSFAYVVTSGMLAGRLRLRLYHHRSCYSKKSIPTSSSTIAFFILHFLLRQLTSQHDN